MFNTRFLSAAAVALFAGCTVGPNFESPGANLPGSFRGDDNASSESIADLPWWKVYREEFRCWPRMSADCGRQCAVSTMFCL